VPARLYSDLAPWFHLVTSPREYVEEAEFIGRVIEDARTRPARTLLELGSGGGNNASHLCGRYECTLTDISPAMLELSRAINPGCEHIVGDMRSMRLDRLFDVVLVHDAIDYMTTEADLRAALATVAAHLRPGGLAIVIPDDVLETFAPCISMGGEDGDDGRGARFLEWTHDIAPGDTTVEVDFVFALREPGGPTRVEHDRHIVGLFPRATWNDLLAEAGLEPVAVELADPFAAAHVVFVARRC
jgi:SAM-dependent methyltransferase